MILDKKGNTSIITQEKVSIIELVKKIEVLFPKFKNDNIIINLSELKPISENDISEFLKLSKSHKQENLSFVIVSSKANIDEVSDEIMVVPTLQEAFDVVEMEEIERDLGL